MKQILDMVPAIAFVIAYFTTYDFMVATGVILVASVLQMGVAYALFRSVEKMYWISFIILAVAAVLTLTFNNPLFLKWKPTIVSALFASIILGSDWIFKKPIVKTLTEMGLKQSPDMDVNAPDPWWRLWNTLWGLFFITTGALNLWVAYTFEEAAWVKFKLFGLTGCNIAFTILFIVAISQHLKSNETPSPTNQD